MTASPRRALLGRLVLLASVVVATFALPSAPAEAKVVHRKAPSSSSSRPLGGEPFVLSGTLGKSTARTAAVQRRSGSRWVTVKRATIGRTGHYRFTVTQQARSTSWRVVAAKVRKHGRSFARRESARRSITLARQSGSVAGGSGPLQINQRVTLTASFSPVRRGRPVDLQVNDGTGWRTAASATQGPAGRASFAWSRSTSGVFQVRAATAARGGAARYTSPTRKLTVLPAKRMKVAAHRGFSAYFPENTLLAYEKALLDDADFVETDWQRTAPDDPAEFDPVTGTPSCVPEAGVSDWRSTQTADADTNTHFIALHDEGFSRTTDVLTKFPPRHPVTGQVDPRYKVRNGQLIPVVERFTLCEIKQLDASSWKRPGSPVERVPTLEEALTLVTESSNSEARIMVEPKLGTPEEAEQLYDTIAAFDQEHLGVWGYQRFLTIGDNDRAVFNTFSKDVADALHAIGTFPYGDAEIDVIADQVSETDPARVPYANALFLRDDLVTQARIDAIHRAGQEVVVWTPNQETRWWELAAMGVDVVVTDRSRAARPALPGTD